MKAIYKDFDEKKALSLIRVRYQRMEGKITFTIKRLERSGEFRKVFSKMRSKGYPDWVLYMTILNTVINYRINNLPKKPQSTEEHAKIFFKYLDQEEKRTDQVVPVNEFTEEKLEMAIDLFIMSFLKGEGYEFRRATPNIKAVRKFAEEKYRIFDYDLPHNKWFNFEK